MTIKIKNSLALFLISSGLSQPLYAVDTEFYSLNRDSDNATNLTNPIIPIDINIDQATGRVNVEFEFDKTNSSVDPEACVTIDYVQILTNRDLPESYDENGNPIVSKWETVWERDEIRTITGGDEVEPLDIDLLHNYCIGQSEISDFTNFHKARGDADKWSFGFEQGWNILGGRHFNSSSDYQDAELRVGITYLPKRYPYDVTLSQTSDTHPSSLNFGRGGFVLNSGESITTANRRLVMQGDGNLVLQQFSDDQFDSNLWASNSNTGSGKLASFQSDGNFVVYNTSGLPIWASNTASTGHSLSLQADGNLVIYNSTGQSIWASNTNNLSAHRDEEWQVAFKADVILSLHDTIEKTVEIYDHQLKVLPEIPGWDLPSAYHYDTEGNIGCLGIWTGVGLYVCVPAIADTAATETWLVTRHDLDRLIMCPGSVIPEHVDQELIESQGSDVPTDSNQPYPQVMADTNYAWCDNVEMIERRWTDLTQIAEEGWMISLNDQTGNLECIANNGVCANSIIDNFVLSDIDTPEKALNLETLILTDSTPSCQYSNNAIFACPSELLFESPSISSVVNAFQQTKLLDVFSLSFTGAELSLLSGESIETHNRRLKLKSNGNLVLQHYVNDVNEGLLWEAGTDNTGAVKVTFQNDGNLVIRDSNNTAIWATGTHVGNGDSIKLQGNGDLVIYAATGEPLWSSGTAE